MRILIIGDPHAHPHYDNRRFRELGAFARVVGADLVHCVGDWTDFPSLNEHKSKAEQRPDLYEDDVEAGNHALAMFADGLGGYACRKTITLGNHDVYPARWASQNPRFTGRISPEDVRFDEHGWEVYPFDVGSMVGGLLCSHYFPSSPSSNRPQGGIHVAHQLLQKQKMNCVVGHNHRFDMKIATAGDGRKLHAFSAGCMNHPDYDEGWCRSTRKYWDRGVLVLDMNQERVEAWAWYDYDAMRRKL